MGSEKNRPQERPGGAVESLINFTDRELNQRPKSDDYRETLPYGMWICRDRVVLFNRDYDPIWIRWHNTGKVEKVDHAGWQPYEVQLFFYDDADPPQWNQQTKKRLETILRALTGGR